MGERKIKHLIDIEYQMRTQQAKKDNMPLEVKTPYGKATYSFYWEEIGRHFYEVPLGNPDGSTTTVSYDTLEKMLREWEGEDE